MATIQTKVQITGDATGAKKALSDVQRSMNDMTQKARNMGNVIKGATRPDSIADMGMYLGKLSDQAKTATGSIGAISSLAASFGGLWGVAIAAVGAALAALANKFDIFGEKAKEAREAAVLEMTKMKTELENMELEDIVYGTNKAQQEELKKKLEARNKQILEINKKLAENVEKQGSLYYFNKNTNRLEADFRVVGGRTREESELNAQRELKRLQQEALELEKQKSAIQAGSLQMIKDRKALEEKSIKVDTKTTKAAKVAAVPVEPGVGSIAYFEKKVAEATKAYKEAISAEEREIYKQDIQFFQDIIDTINGKSIEIKVDTTELEDTLDLVDTKIEDTFNTKAIDAVSKTFGDMSNALGEYADDSKSAAQAQKALFMAEHAAAFASAIANGAKLPWPENLAAIGSGVAAVVAAFAQATKFANGGIVGGNSHNDGILARVSSGEMILNKNEQSNLFRMLRNGTATGAGDVNFVITGDSLQGTLNNRNRTINRMR